MHQALAPNHALVEGESAPSRSSDQPLAAGPATTPHASGDRDCQVKCIHCSRQCVLWVTVFALFLNSFGYDPYRRDQELAEQQLGGAQDGEDDDGVLYHGLSSFHDPEQEAYGDEQEIDIQPQFLLYVPRIVALVLCSVATFARRPSFDIMQRIISYGHLVVALVYTLLHAPDFLSYELRLIGGISEAFWAAKCYLYFLQITLYSPPAGERLHYLLAGALAMSLGSAALPLFAGLGATYPLVSQYLVNLVVVLLQIVLLQPLLICGTHGSLLTPNVRSSQSKFRAMNLTVTSIVIFTVAIDTILMQWFLTDNSTLLRPFLPLLTNDIDPLAVFWQLFYVAIAFSGLGFLLIYLRTADLMVAAFGINFLTGTIYLYLEEEPIPARLCLPMSAFVVAVALDQLVMLAKNRHQMALMLGLGFTAINLTTYAFFALLLVLWSSPDVTIIVVWAWNGFFALMLVVLRKWLDCEPPPIKQPPTVDETTAFTTRITTIA